MYGGGGLKHVVLGGTLGYCVKSSISWKSFSFISASAPALVLKTGGSVSSVLTVGEVARMKPK